MNGVRFLTGALGARGSNKWLMAVPCEYADSVGQQVALPDVSGGKIISSCLCCSVSGHSTAVAKIDWASLQWCPRPAKVKSEKREPLQSSVIFRDQTWESKLVRHQSPLHFTLLLSLNCPSMDFNSDQRKVMSVTVSLYALHPEHKSYLGTRTRITPATLWDVRHARAEIFWGKRLWVQAQRCWG